MSDRAAFTRPRPTVTAPVDRPGGGTAVSKSKKQHVSAEGRQRLSELAKRRHQQGGFSATGKSSRKREPKASRERVAQLVAEAALEKKTAEDIIQVFKDGIADHQPMHLRLKAAEAWIGIEREEGKLQVKEEAKVSEHLDREQALAILATKLTQGHAANVLRRHMAIDVEARDVSISDAA